MKKHAHLHRMLGLLVCILMSSLAIAQSAPAPSGSDTARQQLKKTADLSPAQIADEADAIKIRRDQLKVEEARSQDDRSTRTRLKQQFQRDFAAAADGEAREQLLAEYLAKARVLAAGRELALQETGRATGSK